MNKSLVNSADRSIGGVKKSHAGSQTYIRCATHNRTIKYIEFDV